MVSLTSARRKKKQAAGSNNHSHDASACFIGRGGWLLYNPPVYEILYFLLMQLLLKSSTVVAKNRCYTNDIFYDTILFIVCKQLVVIILLLSMKLAGQSPILGSGWAGWVVVLILYRTHIYCIPGNILYIDRPHRHCWCPHSATHYESVGEWVMTGQWVASLTQQLRTIVSTIRHCWNN